MAIIYSYPVSTPKVQDLLLGTSIFDENDPSSERTNPTVSFTVQSLVNLIGPIIGLPNLQQVTGAGNTTTNSITIANSLSVNGSYIDSGGQTGISGQILSSTATGTSWVNNVGGLNYYVTGASFDITTGVLAITGNNVLVGASINLDGRYLTANETITLSGDITGTGTTAITTTLATVNATVGAFTNANITVNAKGLITAAASGSSGGATPAIITTADGTLSFGNTNVTAATVRTKIGAGTSNLVLGTTSTTALAGDTTTISTAQADEITANTAKVGITTGQANAIVANTAKVTDTGVPAILSNGTVPSLNSGITGAEVRTLIGAGDVTASSTTTFTNKLGSNSQWTNDEGYTTNTGTVTASSTDAFTNKSGAISMWTNDSGYITSYTEADTLQTVTARGASSSVATNFTGSLTVNGSNAGAYFYVSGNAQSTAPPATYNTGMAMVWNNSGGSRENEIYYATGSAASQSENDASYFAFINRFNTAGTPVDTTTMKLYGNGNLELVGPVSTSTIANTYWRMPKLAGSGGQILARSSSTIDLEWSTASSLIPDASTSAKGLIKLGDDTELDTAFVAGSSGSTTRTYPVQINSSNQAAVYVPWSSGGTYNWIVRDNAGTPVNKTLLSGEFLQFKTATGALSTGLAGSGTTSDPYVMTLTSPNDNTTNLGYTGSTSNGIVTSSTGTSATLPLVVDNGNAGLMTGGDKNKLDGIAAGAQVNVATNLSKTTSTTDVTINSSTGTNVAIGAATTSVAGVMTTALYDNVILNNAKVTDTGVPAILSNSGSPSLNTGITGTEVRTLIGAGTLTGISTNKGLTGGATSGSPIIGAEYTGTNNIVLDSFASTDIETSSKMMISYDNGGATQAVVNHMSLSSIPAGYFNNNLLWTAAAVTSSTGNYGFSVSSGSGFKHSTATDAQIGFLAQYTGSGAGVLFRGTNTSSNTTVFTVSNTGLGTFANDVVAYSDERLKSNIETLDGSKVYEMRGVSFDKNGKKGSGVIAQEMQKIAPELVNEDSEYLGVAYGNISGYLIEAIKELKAEIEELKSKPCNCKQ